jgi:cobalt-zinc-cadmium efflux system outer membrane protein
MFKRIDSRHALVCAVLTSCSRYSCFVLLVFAGSSLSAATDNKLSSAEAVQLAIAQNPLLQAARSVVAQAEGGLLQAGRWDNPELGIRYAGDQAFNHEGEQSFGLAFSQRFPVTKRLQLEKAVAQKEVELARAEIDNQVRLLTQQVQLAVVALAETEAELELRQALSQLNRDFLAFIESRIETGEASQVEADQLRITLYAIQQEARHLQHRQTQQQAELRELMGVAPEYAIRLDYSFEVAATQAELPELGEATLKAHPAYQVRQLLLELAEGHIANARAERWADIAIELFYEEERGVDAPDDLERDRFIGIGISVPLPWHDRNQGNVAKRRAFRNEMQWRLQATASKLRIAAAMQRDLVYTLHAQALEYESEVTALIERNLKAVQDGYANGQISLSELFQTQAQRLKIQSTHIEMLSELAKARIHWSAATALEYGGRVSSRAEPSISQKDLTSHTRTP